MYTLNAKRAKEILYEVFPGHSGIQFESKLDEELVKNFTCYVHFPKITIWNDKQERHDIRDLYVKFGIENGVRIHSFEGTRTSLDEIEVGRYNHSHISQTGYGLWGAFCTGQSFVRSCLSNNLENEDSFYAFLLSLPNFVEHESLEGRPYKYMHMLRDAARQVNVLDDHNFFNDGISCRSSDGPAYQLLNISYDINSDWAFSLTAEDLEPAVEEVVRSFEEKCELSIIINSLFNVLVNTSRKPIIFTTDSVPILTYLSNAGAKEKASCQVFKTVHGKIIFKTQGDVTLLKDKNNTDDSVTEIIENPCVFKFPKIEEDLSITLCEIPAIKYRELAKKYNKGKAASIEWKPSLYNASAALFKILALKSLHAIIVREMAIEKEQNANKKEFLESFL